MTSIGDTLRRERLKRNLAVAKIAGDLKISARFLEAIEAEDFAKLPGGVFTKSFVRQYAAYLGLDPQELVAEVQRTVEPEPPPPETTDKQKPDVPGIPLGFRDDWQSIGESRNFLPSWMRAGALLLFLMLVCSGVYWWWERPHHSSAALETPPSARVIPTPPPSPTPAPAVVKPVSPPPMDAAVTPSANSSVTPAATPPPAPVTAPDAIPVMASNPNASVRISIVAVDGPVWIGAYVDGKYLFSGTLQEHESRNINVDGEVRLRLGNAGGAAITLNGKQIGSVGPKGQVRTVQLTSGGFQIVSPDKSLEPLERL